jgi:hypothetical protein
LVRTKVTVARNNEASNDWSGVFPSLLPKLRRGGLVVVFSDCFGNIENLSRNLSLFRQARNDVVVFQVLDRDELEFPFRSTSEFRSLESTGLQRRIDPGRLRKAYLQRLEKFQAELSSNLLQNRVELFQTVTDRPFGDYLAEFLSARRRAP